MKRIFTLVVLLSFGIGFTNAQSNKNEVLTLGTFHFAFHNKDLIKTEKKDQIDVLDKKYQVEIEDIVSQISNFKPTIIAIEKSPEFQARMDSLYASYLAGTYTLGREEYEQIGFRIGKKLGIKKLYCVNDWGRNIMTLIAFWTTILLPIKSLQTFCIITLTLQK